jgi:phosphatidylglycerol:prolipoprotein diacylglycerol transferase
MGMLLSTPMILAGAWLIWRGLREPVPTTAYVAPEPAEPPATGTPRESL